MGFASLLAQMKRGKSGSPPLSDHSREGSSNNKQSIPVNSSNQSSKPASSSPLHTSLPTQPKYDPAVARLKAARRAEKEALLSQKATSAASKQSISKPSISSASSSSTRHLPKLQTLSKADQLRRQILLDKQEQQLRPLKKLSYKELMQQASKVDGSNMAITIKSKTISPEPPAIRLKTQLQKKKTMPPKTIDKLPELKPRPKSVPSKTPQAIVSNRDKRPSYKENTPLVQRRKIPEEDYDELSDFVVSEDEPLDYHAEILNIFGRKRHYDYDDYDSDDDMEATGADILNEESKSSRIARLEEEREAELERRKKMEKLKRMKR